MGIILIQKSSSIFISLMVITSLAILFLDPACAQIVNSSNIGSMPVDNSTGIGEQESGNAVFSFGAIYTVFVVIVIIYCAIKLRKPKTRTKAKILLILLLVVTILLASYEYSEILIFATFLVIGALIILLVPKRTKKQIQWKKRTDIRRQFPIRVRDEVLKNQKYKCANCDMSISGALIQYDHIDGNRFNIDISNCVALCPNCHSLKTDEDRRNQ